MAKRIRVRTPKKKPNLWARPLEGEHVPRNAFERKEVYERIKKDLSTMGISPEKSDQLAEIYLEKGVHAFKSGISEFARGFQKHAGKIKPVVRGKNFEVISTPRGDFTVPRETYDAMSRKARQQGITLEKYVSRWVKLQEARKPKAK